MAAAAPQLVQNIRDGQPLTANIDPGEVAKAAALGAAGGAIGATTFGVGTAVMGTGVVGMVGSGAISGAVAGQASRAAGNRLSGQAVTEGLGNPTDLATDAALGAAGGAIAYGIGRLARPGVMTETPGRNVPNPHGRLGGPAHQAKVAEIADDIGLRGLTQVANSTWRPQEGQRAADLWMWLPWIRRAFSRSNSIR